MLVISHFGLAKRLLGPMHVNMRKVGVRGGREGGLDLYLKGRKRVCTLVQEMGEAEMWV